VLDARTVQYKRAVLFYHAHNRLALRTQMLFVKMISVAAASQDTLRMDVKFPVVVSIPFTNLYRPCKNEYLCYCFKKLAESEPNKIILSFFQKSNKEYKDVRIEKINVDISISVLFRQNFATALTEF